MKTDFDIIIIGGGMVGLAMAASLVKSELSVMVVEKNDFSELSNGEYLLPHIVNPKSYRTRVSAISPGNQTFLSQLNCWKNLPTSRVADFEKMVVWDGEGSGLVEFDAAEIAQQKLGSIVENDALRSSIYQVISQSSNVVLLENLNLKSIEYKDNKVDVTFIEGDDQIFQRVLSANLLIGADGAFSKVRQELGINVSESEYQQVAFVLNVTTEKEHNNTAWQRFTSNGPVAFLPLPQSNVCSVVWSIDQNKANLLKNISPQELANKLAEKFEHKLGKVTALSQVQNFPLIKRHADSYLAERCVLIGDAAHTIHPLAGQGVNLGFQDVECLSKLIIELNNGKRDFGLKANLRSFERQRKAENKLMQEIMTGFKWFFSQQTMLAVLARNWGMSAVNQSGIIKQLILEKVTG